MPASWVSALCPGRVVTVNQTSILAIPSGCTARRVSGTTGTSSRRFGTPIAIQTFRSRLGLPDARAVRNEPRAIEIREGLVATWKASGSLGDDPEHPSADRIALYFGTGGIYDADSLESRGEMLIEVRDVIDLMTTIFASWRWMSRAGESLSHLTIRRNRAVSVCKSIGLSSAGSAN